MARELTPEQKVAIGYLSQPKRGGKTMDEIAKECKVSRQTLYDWMRQPDFDAELRRQTARNVSKLVPDVLDAMYETSLVDKNAAAAKLILQVAGMLTDKLEVETKKTTEVPDLEELKRMVAEMDDVK
ncbi:phBC6A51 family helix-turn-helix protein [Brevibacillus borstelensis]|uniref:phBC6A51 family helix-turn-helix protein n=1 Tax=Brevibacillus borstelensis TaxID=45462 RepID=UPI0030D1706C